jgi:hypothetical protein
MQKVEDSSFRLRTILNAWDKQQSEERSLRRTYASWLLVGLFLELIIANIAFLCVGLGMLVVPQWVASTFFVGVFGEILGLTVIVVRYLFPKVGDELLQMIQKL